MLNPNGFAVCTCRKNGAVSDWINITLSEICFEFRNLIVGAIVNGNSVFSCGKKLAIVEDEEIVSMMLENVLQNVGYVVAAFSSGEELLGCVSEIRPDLILMDVRLSGSLDGIQTAEQILSEYDVPVVFLTAHSDDEILQRIIRISPYGYLTKPFREKELFCIIEVTLSRHRMEQAMRKSDLCYRTLFKYASDAVYLYELDESGNPGNFIEVNSAVEKQLGYSSEELLQIPPWEIYDEQCRDDFSRMIQKLRTEGSVRCGMIHSARDGTRVPVEICAHSFSINHRQVVLSICHED